MKKSFKYEYEMTPKRKFYNVLENVVNHALLFTFSGIFLGSIVLAVIHLV